MHTTVLPLTVQDARALLEGPPAFRRETGYQLAEGYLAFPEALPATVQALESGMPAQWFSYLIVDPDQQLVVGLGGFTGPPQDGAVEIGYSIAPGHRGRGHATRAARHWLGIAAAAGATRVLAHTLAEENPSTSVLRRLGFELVAELSDPDEGRIWRWDRSLTTADGVDEQ